MIRALRSRFMAARILYGQLSLKRFLTLIVFAYGNELGLRGLGRGKR